MNRFALEIRESQTGRLECGTRRAGLLPPIPTVLVVPCYAEGSDFAAYCAGLKRNESFLTRFS